MVLECKRCLWRGVDLRPNFHDNTACCPSCGLVFKGIPANKAYSPEVLDYVKT